MPIVVCKILKYPIRVRDGLRGRRDVDYLCLSTRLIDSWIVEFTAQGFHVFNRFLVISRFLQLRKQGLDRNSTGHIENSDATAWEACRRKVCDKIPVVIIGLGAFAMWLAPQLPLWVPNVGATCGSVNCVPDVIDRKRPDHIWRELFFATSMATEKVICWSFRVVQDWSWLN